MADQKDQAKDKTRRDANETEGGGGGNAGAGKSGKEGMGSEKPSIDNRMGSQKPGGSGSEK